MRVLGLVTARGGSKGFPGKNLARLAGRPLVAWSHRALDRLRERHPEVVLRLSTDSPDIAAAWPERDRPADLRPAALAGDTSTSLSVVEHELARAAEAGLPCDAVLLVQPTSPLLTVDDLEAMWAAFENGALSVLAAVELDHPVRWSFSLDESIRIDPIGGWSTGARQGESRAYRPAGAWLCTANFVRTRRALAVPGETHAVVVPRDHAVDIDEPADLEIAASLLRTSRRDRRIELGRGIAIGEGEPVFVIAEAGVNHNGDPDLARQLIDAAAGAGADAVKFQTFKPEALTARSASMAAYQKQNLGVEQSQAEMLRGLELANAALPDLKSHAEKAGLVFLSSPFDVESARFLCELGVPALKVGSGELTNHPFLAELAGLGLPLLVSTGMSTLDEVEDADRVIRAYGSPATAWLHCVSSYPAPPDASNLRAMDAIRLAVGGPVGMSDHAMGGAVTLAAVAMGARVIEKHLTLSRNMPGPDHAASLEPAEFAEMMRQVRVVESAMGDGVKRPAACETDTLTAARRSLVAVRDLPAGHVLAAGDLVCKRPATGLPPSMLGRVIGWVLARDVRADEVLMREHLRET
ncbi:MAG: N-acetylneuraminate synthase family protein [Phycisphaeraceae bacterium]|nr:MAG: N-acetylneuraminate synthase family protein [Phycisphaeraceae bacterium]